MGKSPTRSGAKAVATTTTIRWQKFFGHLGVWETDFNEVNYPLGADPGDKAEEVGFNHIVSGHEALAEFKRLKRQPASLWAQGRYIKAHPNAQEEHPLIGIGTRWQCRNSGVCCPVFDWDSDGPNVGINSLCVKFDQSCRFLIRKKKGI